MHKFMQYLCDELEEIERKAEKEGKLSATEIEYADKLLNMKKNLLKAEDLYEGSDYSMEGSYARGGGMSMARGGSYARGSRGNRGGRRGGANQYGSYADGGSYTDYSRAVDDMVQELHEMMQEAPDERTKQEFQRFIKKIEQM